QTHSAFVGADHEIELHGAKAGTSRTLQRINAHRSRNAPADGPGSCHITAVGNVSPTSTLIRLQKVGPDDGIPVLGYENVMASLEPVSERLTLRQVARDGVRLASRKNWLQDRPDGRPVGSCGEANPKWH